MTTKLNLQKNTQFGSLAIINALLMIFMCSLILVSSLYAESHKFISDSNLSTSSSKKEFVRDCVKFSTKRYLEKNITLKNSLEFRSAKEKYRKKSKLSCKNIVESTSLIIPSEAKINEEITIRALTTKTANIKILVGSGVTATSQKEKSITTATRFSKAGEHSILAEFKFSKLLVYKINKTVIVKNTSVSEPTPDSTSTQAPTSTPLPSGTPVPSPSPEPSPPASNDCILPEQEEPAPYTEAGLWYEDFVKTNLGALKEPLIYKYAGNNLTIDPNSLWKHVSENSAAISWQTNLPTKGFIRYGTDSSNLNQSTAITRRFHEQHLHYLKGLETGSPIYYRICGIDERDEIVAGSIETITPAKIPNAKYIPGNMSGAPYVLTSGYYVLTQDIESDTRAFTIQGNDVTLDLNGYKIIYDKGEPLVTGAWNDYVYSSISTFGVMVTGTRWKVLNGTIQQEHTSPTNGHIGIGFNPIYGTNEGEIAGIHAMYSGDDVSGVLVRYGSVNVHHNRIDDGGTKITDRHQGIKAIHAATGDVDYNYISRARHQGIMGGDLVSSNVVHIDSGATNSFGLNLQGGTPEKTLYKNRVYGTGYHIVAVGWKNGMQAINNFIFLAGLQRFNRSSEYGDHCSLNGFRITQYNGASNEFKNMNYLENVVSIHGNSIINQMRPIQLMSNQYVSDILVSGNTFRMHVLDLDTSDATHNNKEFAAVVLHGSTPDTANEIEYRNNTAISNYRIIMGGDSYAGGGSRHYFYNNKFEREGNSNKFSFGRFGWWSPPNYNNRLLNTELVGTMSLDQPAFYGANSARQEYSVGYAYFIKVTDCSGNLLAGSEFSISDSQGTVLNGTLANDAITEIHELDYTMSGTEYNPNGAKTIHTSPLLLVTGRTARPLASDWKNQGKTRETAIEVRLGMNGNQCS